MDVQLLRFLTDEFAHAGGNFSSAVKVWVGQHQEETEGVASWSGFDFITTNSKEVV